MEPYWTDGTVTLYHGDTLELLPQMPKADAVITDPPYGETSLEWDKWPDGWPDVAAQVANQVWCFGSLRMFMDKGSQFSAWKLAQDVVWEKHNGSNSANDRFRRLHELALHYYRGKWEDLHREPQHVPGAIQRSVRRSKKLRVLVGEPIGGKTHLICNSRFEHYRACYGNIRVDLDKHEAIIPPKMAAALKVQDGDMVRVVDLD